MSKLHAAPHKIMFEVHNLAAAPEVAPGKRSYGVWSLESKHHTKEAAEAAIAKIQRKTKKVSGANSYRQLVIVEK